MSNNRFVFLIAMIVLCLAKYSDATTWYVQQGGGASCGSGANNINNPIGSIASAVPCAGPGDTIYIRAGNYSGQALRVASGSDTGSGIFTVSGYPGDTDPTFEYCILDGNHHYRIKHIHIYNPSTSHDNACGPFNYNQGTGQIDDANAYFEDMEVEGFGAGALMYQWANYVTYTRVNIHLSLAPDPTRRTHCMYLSGHHTTVEDGQMHDCPGYGIQYFLDNAYGGWVKTALHDSIFRGNNIYNTGGSSNPGGIVMSHGANNMAYNNIIHDIKNGGGGIDLAYECVNCIVANNTIYNTNGPGVSTDDTVNGGAHASFINNIIYNANPPILNLDPYGTTVCTANLNINSNCTNPGSQTNPQFVNPGGGDFSLQSNSPAIDTATNQSNLFTTDYNHNVRVTPWDMGAIQFGGGGPPPPTQVATQLFFSTEPQNATAGQAMAAVNVQVQDDLGSLMNADTSTVTLALIATQKSYDEQTLVSVDLQDSGYLGTKAIDGNLDTFWYTQFTPTVPPHPHTIIWSFASGNVVGLTYTPRRDGNRQGNIGDYRVAVSQDGSTWGTDVAAGTFKDMARRIGITWPGKTGTFIRLIADTDVVSSPGTNAAEVNALLSSNVVMNGTKVRAAVNGVASFTGLNVVSACTKCVLQATAPGLVSQVSAPFTIQSGAQPPSTTAPSVLRVIVK